MKLTVVIVNYNVCYFLEQTLKSVVKALPFVDGEVFVVDNASVDGSVEMVRAKFPMVICIENKENVGFARANNQAIRDSKGEYVLLLNPDTVVQEDTFVKCCNYMDAHHEAGGMGVYMVDGKGSYLPESKRGLPTPTIALYKILGLAKLFPTSHKFGRYHLGFLDKEQIHEIEILSGAYMLLRKTALDKVGLLDEDYFMYGEDIDLSYRILKGGYKNIYFPETRIIHYKGESTKKSSVNYVLVFYGAMIIFAHKHFKGAYAGIFTFIIQLAIYARALFSIVARISKLSAMPLLNSLAIYGGMYYLISFWETNFKAFPGYYPPRFLLVAVPVYIVTWMVSVYYSGGFDKPFRAYRVVRGVFVGTILISSVSNFIDDYRFSKSLILIGGCWALTSIISLRYLIHFLKYKNWNFDESSEKKNIIVGDFEESKRVIGLIKNTGAKANVLGFISLEKYEPGYENYLGSLSHINDIVKIYKPDEIIFCAKNISAGAIIEHMAQIESRFVDYKIVPDASNFIIGSNSKDANGELYTLDVHLAIVDKNNIRNKRVVDLSLSLFFIACSPLLLWVLKKRWQFIKNMVNVCLGHYSLVGFEEKDYIHLPKIKPGILSPSTEFSPMILNHETIKRLDLIYAKDYKTSTDLNIIFNCFRQLGNPIE